MDCIKLLHKIAEELTLTGLNVRLFSMTNFTILSHEELAEEDHLGSQIYVSKENDFVFEHWKYTPGPGPDDFICSYKDPVEFKEAITSFYFGGPTILNDWIIPCHKHPELNISEVESVIAKAKCITEEEFQKIYSQKTEDKKKFDEKHLYKKQETKYWPAVLQFRFLTFFHSNKKSDILKFRRDSKEAFVVQTIEQD